MIRPERRDLAGIWHGEQPLLDRHKGIAFHHSRRVTARAGASPVNRTNHRFRIVKRHGADGGGQRPPGPERPGRDAERESGVAVAAGGRRCPQGACGSAKLWMMGRSPGAGRRRREELMEIGQFAWVFRSNTASG